MREKELVPAAAGSRSGSGGQPAAAAQGTSACSLVVGGHDPARERLLAQLGIFGPAVLAANLQAPARAGGHALAGAFRVVVAAAAAQLGVAAVALT